MNDEQQPASGSPPPDPTARHDEAQTEPAAETTALPGQEQQGSLDKDEGGEGGAE